MLPLAAGVIDFDVVDDVAVVGVVGLAFAAGVIDFDVVDDVAVVGVVGLAFGAIDSVRRLRFRLRSRLRFFLRFLLRSSSSSGHAACSMPSAG